MIFITALFIFSGIISAQKSIDRLFDKYATKEGFTTVTISGDLLKIAASLDDDDEKEMNAHITEIRILCQEDDHMNVENFYNQVMKDLNLNDYEEFMRVKKSDQDLKMLIRAEGNKIREFLLVSGGKDNALIQIKGNMTVSDAKKFSEKAKKDGGMDITAGH